MPRKVPSLLANAGAEFGIREGHRASRPVPHNGQASSPPARSAAAAASAHNSTAGLPDHDATIPAAGYHAPGELVLQPARASARPQPTAPDPPMISGAMET